MKHEETCIESKGNACGVASLVLGILGLFVVPLVLSPLAIIFGGVGLKKGERFATAGLVLGIVGFVLWLFVAFILWMGFAVMMSAV